MKKMFVNGNLYHRIEVEGNTLNTTVINVLKQLYSEDYKYQYIQLSDLNINELYNISSFKKTDTKYGERVSVLLDNRYMLLLPVLCLDNFFVSRYR